MSRLFHSLIKQGYHNFVPFCGQISAKMRFVCTGVPVGSISMISLHAMEVCMDPIALVGLCFLGKVMGFSPIPFLTHHRAFNSALQCTNGSRSESMEFKNSDSFIEMSFFSIAYQEPPNIEIFFDVHESKKVDFSRIPNQSLFPELFSMPLLSQDHQSSFLSG